MTPRLPVAIIGMSGLMPGAVDLAQFWGRLLDGDNLVTEVPDSRWNWRDYAGNPDRDGNVTSSRWGGFALNVERFDAGLFGISPREAETMDPQQRLLLCAAWEAIENAAIAPSTLAGSRTGVFIGASGSDFKANLEQPGSLRTPHQASGTHQSMLANRISFQFDLRGPSETVDTACSSSLVAIHRALTALEVGEIEMALAGGINLLLNPEMTVQYAKAGMLSPDGRCHTFDHRANGYVRSEGLGCVVLKPLDRALADRDPIHAVVRGSAENHGGKANSLTAPNPRAQVALIVGSIRSSGVAPESIGLVETHGTGTALGDPIEVNALKTAFAQLGCGAKNEPWCALGAVKTSTGHLEAAAGMAGLLKAVFALQHRVLPANLHHERTNPHIDLDGSPFFFASQTCLSHRRAFGGLAQPLRATVSSFGFGGVNAHMLIEEAPRPLESEAPTPRPYPFVLSAPDSERLAEQAKRLRVSLGLPEPSGHTPATALCDELLQHASELLRRPLRQCDADRLFCDIGLNLADVRKLCEHTGGPSEAIDSLIQNVPTLADLADGLVELVSADCRVKPVPDASDSDDECLLVRELPRPIRSGEVDDLRDIAYTLCSGRQVFDERAAFVASTREELAQGLAAIASTRQPLPTDSFPLYRSNPRRGRLAESAPTSNPGVEQVLPALFTWLNEKRPKIDWSELFPRASRRLALPGVALRLKRYPLGHANGHLRLPSISANWQSRLLGENQSDLRQFRYCRTIGANDVVWPGTPLNDPLEQGLRLLEAAAGAVRILALEQRHVRISAMAWAAPEAPLPGDQLHVVLAHSGPGYAIEVALRSGGKTERLLCQADTSLDAQFGASAQTRDQSSWREVRVSERTLRLWSDTVAEALYVLFPNLREGYAPFRLPSAFVCQALDAPIGRVRLRHHATDSDNPRFDIELLDLAGNLHSQIEGLELRRVGERTPMAVAPEPAHYAIPDAASPKVTRLARFEWAPRAAGENIARPDFLMVLDNTAGAPLAHALEARYPAAQITALCSRAPEGQSISRPYLLRLGTADDWRELFSRMDDSKMSGARVSIVLPADDLFGDTGTPLERTLNAQACLLAIAQCGLSRWRFRSVQVLVLAGDGKIDELSRTAGVRSLEAWGRTQRFEQELVELRVLDLGQLVLDSAEGVGLLGDALEHGGDCMVRWDGRQWQMPQLRPLDIPSSHARLLRSRGGSVLISGGLGTLSLMFASHLSDRYGMTVHLCGRRPPDAAMIERWKQGGRRISYHSGDIADTGFVQHMVAQIVATDGRLSGVLHCAGVVRDKMIVRKSATDLHEVLSPKMGGALALDAATAALPLEFFVMFGSVVGAFGNPGQADYAYANAWLGGFADWRREQVASGRRSGHTVSIDWPHWQHGGISMDSETMSQFRARHGLQSLSSDEGLQAFESVLATEVSRVVVLHGIESDLSARFSTLPSGAESRPATAGFHQ